MKIVLLIGLSLLGTACFAAESVGMKEKTASAREYVILLHGLCRTAGSMEKMGKHLTGQGFGVVNQSYPSRSYPAEKLSEKYISQALQRCRRGRAQKIHFVTHSLGGILVRYYLKNHDIPELGRVVMLSPPNQGSEVVDKLRDWHLFQWMNGPAGQQLGTGRTDLPSRLGPVGFELGVITGDRSVNLLLSRLIPGKDDGKVAVARARIAGMDDFLVIHATHPFIMKNRTALSQTAVFLKTGRFDPLEIDSSSGRKKR